MRYFGFFPHASRTFETRKQCFWRWDLFRSEAYQKLYSLSCGSTCYVIEFSSAGSASRNSFEIRDNARRTWLRKPTKNSLKFSFLWNRRGGKNFFLCRRGKLFHIDLMILAQVVGGTLWSTFVQWRAQRGGKKNNKKIYYRLIWIISSFLWIGKWINPYSAIRDDKGSVEKDKSAIFNILNFDSKIEVLKCFSLSKMCHKNHPKIDIILNFDLVSPTKKHFKVHLCKLFS